MVEKITRRLLGWGDMMMLKAFSPKAYFRFQHYTRRITNPGRRGGERLLVDAVPEGYRVSWRDGTTFYFSHHRRYHRYDWPTGLRRVQSEMLEKYQDGDVSIRPDDIVLEVGANVGEFTTAAAGLARFVVALEPDPLPFKSLRANAKQYNNIDALDIAASDSAGELNFYLSTATADSSVIEPPQWDEKISVKAIPIDELVSNSLANKRWPGPPTFLKVEAEGYEPEVLRGATRILRNIRAIAVDTGPERYGQPTTDECERILTEANIRTWRSKTMLFGIRD